MRMIPCSFDTQATILNIACIPRLFAIGWGRHFSDAERDDVVCLWPSSVGSGQSRYFGRPSVVRRVHGAIDRPVTTQKSGTFPILERNRYGSGGSSIF